MSVVEPDIVFLFEIGCKNKFEVKVKSAHMSYYDKLNIQTFAFNIDVYMKYYDWWL